MWEYNHQFIMIGQVFLAFFLGACVGFEREYHHSPAGIRTYAAVSLGACLFGLISTHAQGGAYYSSIVDPTRIAAQVVSGIGFLCAGVIFRQGSTTSGLTTAATIWATAAVGLGVAFGLYAVSVVTTLIILLLLMVNSLPFWKRLKAKRRATDRLGSKKNEQTFNDNGNDND